MIVLALRRIQRGAAMKSLAFFFIMAAVVCAVSPIQDYFWLYEADRGEAFSQKPSGFRYGWNDENTGHTYERNSDLAPDERYDRGIVMGDKKWEMEVEPGIYRVLIVAGDAGVTDAVYKINVENTLVVNGIPSSEFPWVTGYADVEVTDGKLTISSAPGAENNRLAYLHVYSQFGKEYAEEQFVTIPVAINLGGGAKGGFIGDREWTTNAPHGCFVDSGYLFQRFTSTYDGDIPGTELDEVFKTYRTPIRKTEAFTYRIRTPEPGSYFVALLVAEFHEGLKSGRRKGELLINGDVVKTLDYADDIGYGNGKIFEFEATTDDGILDIGVQGLGGLSDNIATLSGIVVGTESFSGKVGASPVRVTPKRTLNVRIANGRLRWTGLRENDNIELFTLSGKRLFSHQVSRIDGHINLEGVARSVVTARLSRNGRTEYLGQLVLTGSTR